MKSPFFSTLDCERDGKDFKRAGEGEERSWDISFLLPPPPPAPSGPSLSLKVFPKSPFSLQLEAAKGDFPTLEFKKPKGEDVGGGRLQKI